YAILIRPYNTKQTTLNFLAVLSNIREKIVWLKSKIVTREITLNIHKTLIRPRARYNKERYGLYKEPNIESFIIISRLRWLGHVGRLEKHRKAKMITTQRIEGTRMRERPRSCWVDCVECDLAKFRIRNWTKQDEDLEG
ncbi:hypothetical protein C0J52_02612, partial [Blattella germanica]